MYKRIWFSALVVTVAGCASAEKAAFDPSVDERIGAEVKRACFPPGSSGSGGYRRIGDFDAFVTGLFNRKYLLVFSGGCGGLSPGGDFPVFRNVGDNCRRQGEFVQTASASFGVSGGCFIEHIYEWDRDKPDEEAEAES